MSGLNWNMAQVPNMFAAGIEGRRAGVQDRDEETRRRALQSNDTRLLRTVDPEAAYKMEDRGRLEADRDTQKSVLQGYNADPAAALRAAFAAGNPDLIRQVSELDEQQRETVVRNSSEVASVAFALKGMSVEQRRAALQSPDTVEYLAARGMTPDRIAGFDPTDANLDVVIGQGTDLKDLLAQQNKDREFQLKSDNIAADNQRGERQVGIAQQRVGIAAQRANRAPAARGGSGGAPSPGQPQRRVLGTNLDPNDGW